MNGFDCGGCTCFDAIFKNRMQICSDIVNSKIVIMKYLYCSYQHCEREHLFGYSIVAGA